MYIGGGTLGTILVALLVSLAAEQRAIAST
jgi:hypothetical protein